MTETLTRHEAACFLHVSIRTLDRLRLPCVKAGRRTLFFKSELVADLEGNRIQRVVTPEVVRFPSSGRPTRKKQPSIEQDAEQRHLERLQLIQAA